MIRLKQFAGPVVAIAAIVYGFIRDFQYNQDLSQALGALHYAQQTAEQERANAKAVFVLATRYATEADSLEKAAKKSENRARHAEGQLAQANTTADKLTAEAPDTCAIYLSAVVKARDIAVETADEWQDSYEQEKAAAGKLRARGDSLEQSNTSLVKVVGSLGDASKTVLKKQRRSFFAALTPDFGVHATVGIDPLKPEDGIKKVVGIGAHWSF